MLNKLLAKLFGSKSDKDIKEVMPMVEEIKAEYDKLQGISDDELRGKTFEVKAVIDGELESIDQQLKELHERVEQNPKMDINEKERVFAQIDKLEEDRNTVLEEVLLKVLPQAFAIVRETARRFKDNGKMEVNATLFDKQMAAKHEHISIEGEKSVWSNEWLAAGQKIKWDMLHYEVQLIGGIVLHQGKIAEMATGEGKTLVATLPAFLNALAKRGVHVITVNDYLAKRDAEWMAPLFQFHQMTVDCIDKYQPNSDERRAAYKADITYGTNNEFGFDYLRDNMAREMGDLVQRKHHFAMVDEVDSVLVDEARTPLIISGPVPKGDEHEFYELKPRISRLYEAQKKLVNELLQDAKKKVKEGNTQEGGLSLFRAHRGLPKYKPLIRFLSATGNKQIMQKTENFYLQDNSRNMPEADAPLYFTIEEKNNNIDLTEKGIDLITQTGEDPQFFIMPDIGTAIADLEKDEEMSDEEKVKQKDELIKDYAVKSQRIHTVNQLLKAYALFEIDQEYIIADGKIKIVDEQTGRVMDGRRYSDGLHQAIEAKENVKVEEATQTYATITLQNYFRMYHKLAGMTGTAETEAGEFWEIYKLDVVVIPTNRPIVRDDRQDLVFKTMREKFNAVVDEINELSEKGRPILVGTTSVEISEILSRMLKMRNVKHNVLNAKQHQREAEIVAEAGQPGTVTIATNMAGRGTDIKLSPESKQAGGLAIIGTERHESRRVDRQLRGRAGRQGDPGSSQFFVSLEDNLMRLFGSDRIAKLMDRMGLEEGEVIQHSMVTSSIERAQKKVEENNFAIRKRLLEYDNVMNQQREVIYERRKNALQGERLSMDIMTMLYDTCEDIVLGTKGVSNYESFKLTVLGTLAIDYPIEHAEFDQISENQLTENLYQYAYEQYGKKNEHVAQKSLPVLKNIKETRGATVENILVPFTNGKMQLGVSANLQKVIDTEGGAMIQAMEKAITLAIIDQNWKEHLREMDDLKQSVQNAVYEQKDPLLIYKFEAFELFKRFIAKVNEETISFLMKADIPVQSSEQVREARSVRQKQQKLKESKEEVSSSLDRGSAANAAAAQRNRPPAEPVQPAKTTKVAGRNDRVNVQYSDGSIKKNVKFKTVEDDLKNNRCVIVDD
ncbi:preprotein translocase subunit SecA [Catalinimonas alkaloidigena]|uniref:preprotein translocase subunit SecA n=1 Tax=Catalinimonas alkaloidigena TaxID=1075417 RepID=UPI002405BB43|nr:preprotein translocase subunit SecA [Catalinimonas alkaloidigena]MDF9798186.1 preprotein translocase subunit SecA [Catalinimonas alkaloidigena]